MVKMSFFLKETLWHTGKRGGGGASGESNSSLRLKALEVMVGKVYIEKVYLI